MFRTKLLVCISLLMILPCVVLAEDNLSVTVFKNITSLREPNQNIDWEVTIGLFNNNSYNYSFGYKYHPPIDGYNFRMDGNNIALKYDLINNTVAIPYVSITDTLPAQGNGTYFLEYITNPVTVDIRRYFPDVFFSDEPAEIVVIAKMRSYTEEDVSDFNVTLLIEYAENLRVCDGEYRTGCPSWVNESEDVYTDIYGLNFPLVLGNQVAIRTVSYEIPTVTVISEKRTKLNLDGELVGLSVYDVVAVTPLTLPIVALRTDIPCDSGIQATNALNVPYELGCRWERVAVWLPNVDPNEEFTVFLVRKLDESDRAQLALLSSAFWMSETTTVSGYSIALWQYGLVVLIILGIGVYWVMRP